MNKRTLAMALSLLLMGGILCSLYILNRQNYNLYQEYRPKETIEVWASTPALIELCDRFERKYPEVHINRRYFYNQDVLLEELTAALSAGTYPDMAEIGSHYGLLPLIETGLPLALNEMMGEEERSALHAGIRSRFEYDGKLWAWPIGFSIPILFYHKNLLDYYEPGVVSATVWDDLWQLSARLQDTVRKNNPAFWGFHTDTQTPWYLLTMLSQLGRTDRLPQQIEALTARGSGAFTQWERALKTYALFPRLTHQMAVTQFVNGLGGILLSSSEKLPLLERLIAGKFQLGALPLPRMEQGGEEGNLAGGKGLMLLANTSGKKEVALTVLKFLNEQEQLDYFSGETGYIPAIMPPPGQELIRRYTNVPLFDKTLREEMGRIKPLAPTPADRDVWERIRKRQEQLEQE
ncbi:ABC transporter substrate-binding protein [Paenibacillus thalictri]|uniref:ABC transporter substrate-binding protein n=1 Tax=Paenibacillus thalictri TaxID=2527873 RepID=UPI0013EEF9DB|nr:extracellular solute-binding protein [Paenibacillus thalictri]